MEPYLLEQVETAQPSGLHAVLRFLRVVNRQRMILVGALAAAAFLGFVRFKRLPRQYSSSMRLMVTQQESSGEDGVSSQQGAGLAGYKQLLLSDVVLSMTIEKLKPLPPELTGVVDKDLWLPVLRNMLSVKDDPAEQTLEISCVSGRPQSTLEVLDTLRETSKTYIADFQEVNSQKLRRELEANRSTVETRLSEKELELLKSRRESGDLMLTEGKDELHPLAQRVSRLTEELSAIQKRRLEIQSTLEMASQLVATNADLTVAVQKLGSLVGEQVIERMPGTGGMTTKMIEEMEAELKRMEAEMDALRPHFGARHSDMIRRQKTISSKQSQIAQAREEMRRQVLVGIREPQVGQWLLGHLQAELAATVQLEKSVIAEYSLAESEAQSLSDELAQIQSIEREAETLRNLHQSLLTQLNSLDFSSSNGGYQVALLSNPLLPSSASYPIMHQVLGMFCVVGFLAGIGIIYVRDLLDDRLRSPEEVREQLGLPVLAVIRKLPDREVEQAKIYVHGFPQTPHAECFRTLKTSLTLSALETKCLAITSTEASEGKTTTTVNLAASYAQTGVRTLLIDADMRRPVLSRLLEIRGQGGLSEVLRAESDVAGMARERIVQTDVPLLDVLPCGPRILNAGMLLSMPTLPDLLDWAVSEYDQVIVDCPPTLPVSDAAIVGRYVDGMLFLMNPDKTHRRSVVRAVDQLRSMELKIVGVVANTSLNEEKSGYGYQYGYGYGYTSDYTYGHDEEDDFYDSAVSSAATGATMNPLTETRVPADAPTGAAASDLTAPSVEAPDGDGDLDDEFERAA
ncbi:MAG: polysaccharide biosynthesis tyrosine autokinase [Planctomycetaceae bacterium]|nr:polysaccharide biosynthesis tyrosine autokinase [Planctomycetaceae bacterium]